MTISNPIKSIGSQLPQFEDLDEGSFWLAQSIAFLRSELDILLEPEKLSKAINLKCFSNKSIYFYEPTKMQTGISQNTIAIIIVGLLVLVFAIYLGYLFGKQVVETEEPLEFRRPVGTFLYYQAPEEIQEELAEGLVAAAPFRGVSLPEEFDARDKWPDAIGGAMDQGTCGSCWAFSAATALSDRFRIAEPKNKELRNRFKYRPFVDPPEVYVIMNQLSPYELVSCDICALTGTLLPDTTGVVEGIDGQCDLGCEGGFLQHVYKYLELFGVTTMICTPPTCDPNDPPHIDCNCERGPDCRVYKPRSVYGVFTSADTKEIRRRKIMEEIYTYGPVSASYTVYNSFYSFFQKTPTGIYSKAAQPENDLPIGGHAVVLVGWGVDEETGIFYWLARNSWGPYWGDNGFFRIEYDWGDFLEPIYMAGRV